MARQQGRRSAPAPSAPAHSRLSAFSRPSLLAFAVGVLALGASVALAVVSWDRDSQPKDAGDSPFIASVDQLRQPIHEHVDFALYLRGERSSFDSEEFLATEDFEPGPNAHIHAPRTNVIHAHREQTTWSEVFTSLGFTLSDECLATPTGEEFCNSTDAEGGETLKFIVNGVIVDSIFRQSLSDLDRVLVSFGPAEDPDLERQLAELSDEACIPSESCRDRMDPNNPEKEPCRKSETVCVG